MLVEKLQEPPLFDCKNHFVRNKIYYRLDLPAVPSSPHQQLLHLSLKDVFGTQDFLSIPVSDMSAMRVSRHSILVQASTNFMKKILQKENSND